MVKVDPSSNLLKPNSMNSACFSNAISHLYDRLGLMNDAKQLMQTHAPMSAATALVLALSGCGSPVSDQEISAQSAQRRSTTAATMARAHESQPMSETTIQGSKFEKSMYPAAVAEQGANDARSLNPSIPQSVEKDLSSPDARMRYRALDFWDVKDSKAPLDPVFEALEDEDEAVRAKAEAIVQQRWEAEQEKEQG
jgi:hypothetical protein